MFFIHFIQADGGGSLHPADDDVSRHESKVTGHIRTLIPLPGTYGRASHTSLHCARVQGWTVY